MSKQEELKQLLENSTFSIPKNFKLGMLILILTGIGTFAAGLFGHKPELAWQALLINTVFFAGLSHAGIMFSVLCSITGAQWPRPIKRLSEACAAFIPFSWILFAVLFFGAEHLYEWIDPNKVIHSKEAWLNFSFFVKRNVVLILGAGFTSIYYVKVSLRPDIGLAQSLVDTLKNKFALGTIENYEEQKIEEEKSEKKQKIIAPILAVLYLLFSSIMAFDWIMSLDQEWFSTMFGVQYMVSSLMAAGAFMMIISGIFREKFQLQDYINMDGYHDLAKLTFSACLMWTYMIFSQVIVIWYANLPEETPYMILRMQSHEWGWMFWFICVVLFQVPLWGLMSKTACRSIWFSRIIAVDILIGVWLEKYFLIVPSIQENQVAATSSGSHHGLTTQASNHLQGFSLNYIDVGIAIGLTALFLLSFLSFLEKVPVFVISDKKLAKTTHH